MRNKQHSQLVNVNRLLVLIFTLMGMSMDGYVAADLPTTAALVVWLWMPTCTALEEKIVNYFSNERQAAQPALSAIHED